ncbi:hypothetical protein [Paenibacillus radicis (ex Gao et al. 2016)]|uniref:Aminoacyl-transfer RNA synthetases class-II family profile domain-containing protein n=1 Tax=Paenibacillus radicis (ex Gao et al. 2016) TaxID=1737354 RepID=A0A917M0I1_9BACL|nr:hypothetical protein [Paenibacillus radicis (ex Gao et al. 2016)]GGG70002.1 hypothetical protein GCM10010918_26560 [Paenibacillus radicis (ex Gao et al. 2016)]
MSVILNRILNQIGDPELLDKLLSLSNADLNSLLLELFDKQTEKSTPADVLKTFQSNRFSTASDVNAARFHILESQLLKTAEEMDIETLLLSPSAPLGSCSVFGCVNQYNVVSSVRGTETLSDPSNMLAIIIADKLKSKAATNILPLHYAATARVVRAQAFSGRGFSAHFGLFCMVSSGKDSGSYNCEIELLTKHFLFYKELIREHYNAKLSIVMRKRGGYTDGGGFFTRMTEVVQTMFPDTPLTFDYENEDNKYYQGINFKIYMEHEHEKIEIGDGGFVDWMNQMLGSKKERCLISGIGLDRLLMLHKG